MKVLKGESFGEGVRVFIIFCYVQTFFCLAGGEITGRCSRNLVLGPKLPSSTWEGALLPTEELKGIAIYIPWVPTRTLPQGCTIVSWLLLPCFCISSLPWLATVRICPLELREGQRGWMKPISYKQEMGGMKGICIQEGFTGSCFISVWFTYSMTIERMISSGFLYHFTALFNILQKLVTGLQMKSKLLSLLKILFWTVLLIQPFCHSLLPSMLDWIFLLFS